MYASVDPSTGQQVASFPTASQAEVEAALHHAQAAFLHYKTIPLQQRCQWLLTLADTLDQQATACAQVIALEMGKSVVEATAEVHKCAVFCRYYAQQASALDPKRIPTQAASSYVRYEPIGPLLAVMPWNFPFLMPFKMIPPAILLGNPVVLKHAHNVPQTALKLVSLATEAGLPAHFLQTVFLSNEQVAQIIADERIAAVTFTGSQSAGAVIAACAGQHRKKIVMELGGSDPFIVFDDVDIPAVAAVAAGMRCANAGQSCVSPKRILVQTTVAQAFLSEAVKAVSAKQAIAPLASRAQLETVERQVSDALQKGAQILCGGKRRLGPGYYFEPTVITGITKTMLVAQEEVFGPVMLIHTFSDDDDALQQANNTRFGLGASVWTTHLKRQQRLIEELQTGMVFVNSPVFSDVRLPFGGTKDSGFGREQSTEGLLEFANIKTVAVFTAP